MKLFQKAYPLTSIMLLSSGILFAIDSKQIKESIENAYIEIFLYKHNIFADKIGDGDSIRWRKMLGQVENYVDANASGNKKLISAYALSRRFSDKLFSTISGITDSVFSIQIWSKYSAANAIHDLKGLREDFDDYLKKTSTVLKKTTFYVNSQKKNNAKEVILYLIKILEAALDKTWGDFDNHLGKLERMGEL